MKTIFKTIVFVGWLILKYSHYYDIHVILDMHFLYSRLLNCFNTAGFHFSWYQQSTTLKVKPHQQKITASSRPYYHMVEIVCHFTDFWCQEMLYDTVKHGYQRYHHHTEHNLFLCDFALYRKLWKRHIGKIHSSFLYLQTRFIE